MMDNINILVAEDFEFNQLVIKQLLKDIGSRFVIVSNGREALDQLSVQQFDIIFMDIEMPVMDGIEATREIKSSESELIKQIPVIGFTGHKDLTLLDKLKKEGFVDFVNKPFKKEEIEAKIKQYVLSSKEHSAEIVMDTTQNISKNGKAYDLTNLFAFSDNDEEFVRKMLDYFVGNSPKVISRMKESHSNKNWSDLKMEAHKFNSELGLLGISEMIILAEQIEDGAAQLIDSDQLLKYIDRLEMHGQLVIDQLKSDFNL